MTNRYPKSPRLLFRPLKEGDIPLLHHMNNEQSHRRWFYFLEPASLTMEHVAQEVARNKAAWAHGRVPNPMEEDCSLGIEHKETGVLIGTIGLAKAHGEEQLEHVEIGYSILEAHQNRGYATEAARAMLGWGLTYLKTAGEEPRIAAAVEYENWPSRKVAEKAGMQFAKKRKYVTMYVIER